MTTCDTKLPTARLSTTITSNNMTELLEAVLRDTNKRHCVASTKLTEDFHDRIHACAKHFDTKVATLIRAFVEHGVVKLEEEIASGAGANATPTLSDRVALNGHEPATQ